MDTKPNDFAQPMQNVPDSWASQTTPVATLEQAVTNSSLSEQMTQLSPQNTEKTDEATENNLNQEIKHALQILKERIETDQRVQALLSNAAFPHALEFLNATRTAEDKRKWLEASGRTDHSPIASAQNADIKTQLQRPQD